MSCPSRASLMVLALVPFATAGSPRQKIGSTNKVRHQVALAAEADASQQQISASPSPSPAAELGEGMACPSPDCSGHGTCNLKNGYCRCQQGWDGPDCSKAMKMCENHCSGHGNCNNGTCECNDGWSGVDCNTVTTMESPACSHNCSGHGTCNNGRCVCSQFYGGQFCEVVLCPNYCNFMGKCVDGKCECDEWHQGVQCEISAPATCPLTLHHNEKLPCGGPDRGLCVEGKCDCKPDFEGVGCEIMKSNKIKCPNDCSNHGDCDETIGKCTCHSGWMGDNCARKKPSRLSPLVRNILAFLMGGLLFVICFTLLLVIGYWVNKIHYGKKGREAVPFYVHLLPKEEGWFFVDVKGQMEDARFERYYEH